MGRRVSSYRIAFVRGMGALLATMTAFQVGRVNAAPGDIFTQPAPVIGSDPAKAAELRTGDASVSTQTGALQYSYPVQVPPGRRGMAPSVSLAYSSQAPIYGGIAAGWSLPLGLIRDDTSRSWLPTRAEEIAYSDPTKADYRFLVGESRLVVVTEPHASDVFQTYRIANGDTSYTRYERLNSGVAMWRARAMDGSISLFGESALTSGCTVNHGYAPLTRTVDVFGNEVAYQYESAIDGECRIQSITWGQNANAGMSAFAQVAFTWTNGNTCSGAGDFHAGSQHDYRTGRLIVTGASKLTSITATAFPTGTPLSPVHTRVITLGYTGDTNCATNYAPVRLLSSIQESAWGDTVVPVSRGLSGGGVPQVRPACAARVTLAIQAGVGD